MKQSDNLIPCCFDCKDFVLPEFWEIFDNHYFVVPYCISDSSYNVLFFMRILGRDKAFRADIVHFKDYQSTDYIKVTSLQDAGTIWNNDVDEIKSLFMQDNEDKYTDVYVECQPIQEHDGRYVALKFNYYHTSPDLA